MSFVMESHGTKSISVFACVHSEHIVQYPPTCLGPLQWFCRNKAYISNFKLSPFAQKWSKSQSAVCEKQDDGPGPRCGHTLTAVAAVGEEGTCGYVGPRLILFWGATALEGTLGQAGPQAAAAGTGIRMFLFLMDLCSGVWKTVPWLSVAGQFFVLF
jgi:hypothetical protein